jgi:hypothetical protein
LKEYEMRFVAKFLGIALLAVAGIGLLGWVVMALWNAVLPGVFIGVRAIDYRQALGLLVLSRILFGGFRGGGRLRGRRWQRLEAMTPEERSRFRKDRQCGGNDRSENLP